MKDGKMCTKIVVLLLLHALSMAKECKNCDIGRGVFAETPIDSDLADAVNKFGETGFALPLEPEFDSRKRWTNCSLPFEPLGKCAGAELFQADLMALEFRYCMRGVKVGLSLQDFVSCDYSSYHCHGGYLDRSWKFLETTGVVSARCFPFTSAGKPSPYCPVLQQCADRAVEWKKYKCVSGSVRRFTAEKAIKQEITRNGPVMAFFELREDLKNYRDGVYTCVQGEKMKTFLTLVGWGEENGAKYWLGVSARESLPGKDRVIKLAMGSRCPKLAHAMTCDPQL